MSSNTKNKPISKTMPRAQKKSQKGPKTFKKSPETEKNVPKKENLSSLKKLWYAKLKESGFEDIEYADNEYSHILKVATRVPKSIEGKERFYFKLRNYLTHRPNWTEHRVHRFVAKLYADGATYREIIKAAQDAGHKKFSIFFVHKSVKRFIERAFKWNKTCPEGADFIPDVEALSGPPKIDKDKGPDVGNLDGPVNVNKNKGPE
jgi:hypothetical protein